MFIFNVKSTYSTTVASAVTMTKRILFAQQPLNSSFQAKRFESSIASVPVLGIDLGLTNSYVAVSERGPSDVRIINNLEGIPSVVAYSPDGLTAIGMQAEIPAMIDPKNTFTATKRLIGRQYQDLEIEKFKKLPYQVVRSANGEAWVRTTEGVSLSPRKIAGAILKNIKITTEKHLKCSVKSAVIAVPTYFNEKQRKATIEAAQSAGFHECQLILEPIAAAVAQFSLERHNKTVAVYNIGGGTFDITIVKFRKGMFEVKATKEDLFLGGDKFDQVLVDAVIADQPKLLRKQVRRDEVAMYRLKKAAEKAKIELSSTLQTNVYVPLLVVNKYGFHSINVKFTRARFEHLIAGLVEKTVDLCKIAAADAEVQLTDIENVLLVGGSCRIPKVLETVRSIFGEQAVICSNPEQTIAIGAARYGGVLARNISVSFSNQWPVSFVDTSADECRENVMKVKEKAISDQKITQFFLELRRYIESYADSLLPFLASPLDVHDCAARLGLPNKPTFELKFRIILMLNHDPRVKRLKEKIREANMTEEKFCEEIARYYKVASDNLHSAPVLLFDCSQIPSFVNLINEFNKTSDNDKQLDSRVISIVFSL